MSTKKPGRIVKDLEKYSKQELEVFLEKQQKLLSDGFAAKVIFA